MNTVVKLRVAQNSGNFLASSVAVLFSRRILLHTVNLYLVSLDALSRQDQTVCQRIAISGQSVS